MTKSSMPCALALAAALVLHSFGAGAAPPDLNCDGCVDSSDVADGAVTTPKIADQAVTTGKIAPGAVTENALAIGAVGPGQLQDGAVGAAKLQGASVGTPAIQDSAVTNAKIAPGAVTADKLDPDIDLGGGTELLRTIVVSPVGPTLADNCDELLAALNGITDSNRENPYLIRIEPGIYSCGLNTVDIKPYVRVQGAGVDFTRLVGSADGAFVVGPNSELRGLTVTYIPRNVSAAPAVVAQRPSRVAEVKIELGGPTDFEDEIRGLVISTGFGPVVLEDVEISTATSDQFGVLIEPGSAFPGDLVANNVRIRATRTFLVSDGATAIIRNSVVDGDIDAGTLFEIRLVSTQVTGLVFGTAQKCVGAYNALFEPLDGACQPIAAAP